jgi:cytochrome c oxidase cbb3-type subunit 3
MQQVASYVLSLQGTTPAVGKAPEGEIWKEEAAPAETTTPTDTTQTVTPETQTTTAASL